MKYYSKDEISMHGYIYLFSMFEAPTQTVLLDFARLYNYDQKNISYFRTSEHDEYSVYFRPDDVVPHWPPAGILFLEDIRMVLTEQFN